MSVRAQPSGAQSNVERARTAYGEPPEWILVLARECDRSDQKQVGARIGRSGGYISRILSNKYPARMTEAERLVLSLIASDRVECPLFGNMPLVRCMRTRRRKGAPTNNIDRMAAGQCPKCPINTDKGVRQ
jgi:hypothetical protein